MRKYGFLVVMGLVLSAMPGLAQPAGEAPTGVSMDPEEVPRYLLVLNFLQQAHSLYFDSPSVAYAGFVRSLGMPPGSAAEQILSAVVTETGDTLNRPTWDFSIEDKDAFERAQERAFAQKARDVGLVYRELLQRLEEVDYDTEALRAHIDARRHQAAWSASDRRTLEAMIENSRPFDEALD